MWKKPKKTGNHNTQRHFLNDPPMKVFSLIRSFSKAFTFTILLFVPLAQSLFASSGSDFADARLGEMVCGVKAIYFAEGVLSGKAPDYSQLLAQFPNVKKEGTTLWEVNRYLTKKGYVCRFHQLTSQQLASFSPNVLGFVFTKGKPMSHVHVAQPLSGGRLQVFDHPHPLQAVMPRKNEKPKLVMLVSHTSAAMPFSWTIPFLGLSLLSIVAGILILFKSRNKQKINTTTNELDQH